MVISFGAQRGKTAEEILIKEPFYVQYVLNEPAHGPLLSLKKELLRLISIFDKKKFVVKCRSCGKLATRGSAYRRNPNPLFFWCDDCDITSWGATRHKLTVITTYESALFHLANDNANKKEYRDLIKNLAIGKGLPNRITQKALTVFFSS